MKQRVTWLADGLPPMTVLVLWVTVGFLRITRGRSELVQPVIRLVLQPLRPVKRRLVIDTSVSTDCHRMNMTAGKWVCHPQKYSVFVRS